ncbi:MAG: hypothetical protein ABL308_13855 [Oceanicaulis sp.]
MTEKSRKSPAGPAGPSLSEIAEAAGVGIERRIFRTLVDTLLFPGKAARAAFDRADTHISQLKLFAVLAGLFFSAGAFFEAPLTLSIGSLVPPGQVDAAYASIQAQGADPARVDAALARWGGVFTWPITLIASAIFIVILKLVKPSVTWFGHVLIYLIATNAMTLVAIPLMAGRLISLEVFFILQLSTFLIFFIQIIRLGSSALQLSAGRLILLTLLVVLALFPSLLIVGVLQFGAAWAVLEFNGVSMLEMMQATSAAPSATGVP